MQGTRRIALGIIFVLATSALPANAVVTAVPEWVRPAKRYLVDNKALDPDTFRPNDPMKRADFAHMIDKTFGGGYGRSRGKVRAGEVAATLVRLVGRKPLARALSSAKSPGGWDPELGRRFGTEIVARELGLRHDRPTDEEAEESSANEPMRQADVAYAVWKAATAPNLYAADALRSFELSDYRGVRRSVVKFALSMAGTPYVWGGEWPAKTPSGYPYGAQPAGGMDCSGFIWYVLQEKTSSYSPARPYRGWSLPQRSSSEMAKATPKGKRLRYREFLPGDIVLFAPKGRDSSPADVYHAGLYIGGGWMVHSSGSRAGVSLASIKRGSWWRDQILWGRRVIG
ncbi:MAG TPA: NlpC/P60 family protein [Actinomycetota bacterium]|nr:NlpC/P60 family protein [Actinomycetota bacterium]